MSFSYVSLAILQKDSNSLFPVWISHNDYRYDCVSSVKYMEGISIKTRVKPYIWQRIQVFV